MSSAAVKRASEYQRAPCICSSAPGALPLPSLEYLWILSVRSFPMNDVCVGMGAHYGHAVDI